MWVKDGQAHREYGDKFQLRDKLYQVVGNDYARSEIECVTIPFDNKYYWFKQVGMCLVE